MKLRVQHENGDIETINLIAPVALEYGEGSPLYRLTGGDGAEHFFTLDGFYDGYGRSVAGLNNEEAADYAEAMSDARTIERHAAPVRIEGEQDELEM
jgi:hypothetical protein